MPPSCPRCGFARVESPHCPRCGVEVSRYRADLAARAATPAAAPPAAPAATAPATPSTAPPIPLVAAPAPSPPPAAALVRPAGFWIRVGALLLDIGCVMAAETAFGLMGWALLDERMATAASRAFRFLASPCYFIFFHWARGQTLGKMVFRLRVVDLTGGPLSFGQAALRHVGSWLSAVILGIGYLVAAFRADKRGLHDLIARTRVEHVI
jgi:uncharacterized RDD family membrane protein YckC